MAMLNKQGILGAEDRVIEKHAVPEWGGDVYLRSLRGWERDKFDHDVLSKGDTIHGRAKLVALSLCDEAGNSLGFTDEEILKLSEKAIGPLGRLFLEAKRLAGMSHEAAEKVEKNSTDPNSNSG